MKRLERFINAVRGFGLFAGLYIEKYLEHLLLDSKPPEGVDMATTEIAQQGASKPFLVILFAFLGLIAFIKIVEVIAEETIERWEWLRKLILGDNYIEGVWFNKVPLASPLYGLLRIEISSGSVRINGEQYNQQGALTASWHSEMAKFDGSVLTYAYKATYSKHGREHESDGTSRISFAKASRSGVPRIYNGHFQDSAKPEEACCFTGFRVEEAQFEKLDKPSEKLDAVKDLIAQADKLPQPVRTNE